ncbi:MAG TPA: cytochrome c-type biogenesis protein CcmH [Gaiellaceae bacterium]|nr:cytochrome c-type biogenesis protein CcmH [Gaiellaceae bacterium]
MRILAVLVAALALAGPAAACAHPKTSLGYLEGQVMCPTCHTTLDQSDSAAAVQIERFIQKRIDQCATAGEIKSELVANFGAGILAAPPHKGFDLLAWWLPIGGVLAGALLLAFGVWRWSRGKGDAEEQAEPALDPDEERRLDELLAGME